MADGQLIQGIKTTGTVATAANGVNVCSWAVPLETFARVEATCLFQKVNGQISSSYKLAANVYNQDGYATIVGDVSKYNEEGTTSGFEVILAVTNDNIYATTASADGNIYRVACSMEIYSVEQFIDGYSLLFGGTNEFVTMGNVLSFERTDAFSISCWFKTSDVNPWNFFIGKEGPAGNYRGWGLKKEGLGGVIGSIRFDIVSVANTSQLSVSTSSILNDGNWHHIVATYDGSSNVSGTAFYVDGGYEAPVTNINNLTSTIQDTMPCTIGSMNGTLDYMIGNIDEASIYNKELSLSEVEAIYNSGIPTNIKNLSSASNMVAYWRCGDGDTYPTILDHSSDYQFPVIPDESTNGYDGTATNMEVSDIQFASPGSQALVFGGTNEYVNMGDILDFDYNDAFSISFWFKWSITHTGIFVSKISVAAGAPGYQILCTNTNKIAFFQINTYFTNTLEIQTNNSYNDNNWHYCMITKDSTGKAAGVVFYIDNAPVATTTNYDTLSATAANASDFRLGARNHNDLWYKGSLSDVSVWDKELSPTEVTEIYNNKVPIDLTTTSCAANLAAWWRCGENYSLAANGVPDFSGNGLHGTQVNMEITDVESRTYIGNSMVFDGSDEFIDMGDVHDLNGTETRSWSFWFKCTGGTNTNIIAKNLGSTTYTGYFIFIDSLHRIQVYLINDAGAGNNYIFTNTTTGFGSYRDSVWRHGVVTYDGSKTGAGVIFYMNGVLVPATVGHDTLTLSISNAANFNIGRRPDNQNYWIGNLKDISIWDKVLSLSEVEAIYNAGIPTDLTSSANLVGYWKMGDGVGFNGTMTNMEEADIIKDTPP